MAWYKNGQVTVQSGSRTVLGIGTAWLGQVLPGEGLDVLDGRLQEIAEVISNTELLLVDAYAGAAAVDVAYQILPSASMTKELTRRVNALIAKHEEITATIDPVALYQALGNKVDVQPNAGLMTNVERQKLEGIVGGATKVESKYIDCTDLKDFFTKCLASGSGFYRANEGNIPEELRYAHGYFSYSNSGTWSFTANAYASGKPMFYAGLTADIAAGTWKKYDPMARANHTGVQAISTVDGLQTALNATDIRPFCVYGGSANAITLTSIAPQGGIVRGSPKVFRATATNTGATTINLDTLGAVPAVTVTGAALPAGYIRTDVDTVAVHNGTNWVVGRQVQYGVNTNGSFVLRDDGSALIMGAPGTLVSIAANTPYVFGGYAMPTSISTSKVSTAFAQINPALSTDFMYGYGQVTGGNAVSFVGRNGVNAQNAQFVSYVVNGYWY
ncbi:hypothetical protein [Comamonas terrigena]|uniref:hypothetical protein n=1 Tax=Comamonas terrigena TaxID=32013 RepID=UPI00244A29AA|nr:hypothetical protein [Comamonas terrigena]MDH1700262.1 hypothetical protein [Comamonas terrigena]